MRRKRFFFFFFGGMEWSGVEWSGRDLDGWVGFGIAGVRVMIFVEIYMRGDGE